MPTRTTHVEPAGSDKANKPEGSKADDPQGRSVPESIQGSTRVNIAFPFSKINVQDPSKELADLAAVVADLITALEETAGASFDELKERSQDLADRLS
jgi:hypothetical protein